MKDEILEQTKITRMALEHLCRKAGLSLDWNGGNPVIAKREVGSVTKRLLDAIERLDYGAYDAPRYADFDSWEEALAAVAADGQSGEREEVIVRIVAVLEAHEFECLHDRVTDVHSMREVADEIYKAIC